MKIKADTYSVERLKSYFFTVPEYQREYVWEAEKHVNRFLEDIYNEYSSSQSPSENYFIGTIIIVKNPKTDTHDIIDGQQRLTTIVLALCAFRDYISEYYKNSPNNSTEQNLNNKIKQLIFDFEITSDTHRPRITLLYEEAKSFLGKRISEEIYSEEKTPSIERLESAYNEVYKFIEEKHGADNDSIGYIKYFLTNLELVVIEPESISSALKIFETINQRGVSLNAMDLLKNLIFVHAKESDFLKLKEIWKNILKNLESCNEQDRPLRFLRYFIMAQYIDDRITEDSIYDWLEKDGKEATNYQKEPLKFAQRILNESSIYSELVKATESDTPHHIYDQVTNLGYIGKHTLRLHIVLLLPVGSKFDAEQTNYFAIVLEALFFYYFSTKVQSKVFEREFPLLASKLRKISNKSDLDLFVLQNIVPKINDAKVVFEQRKSSLSYNDFTPQYRLKYILGKIENYVRELAGLPTLSLDDFKQYQIEHILPQTPLNSQHYGFADVNEYKISLSMLGNLLLLEKTINTSISRANDISTSEWFTKKKEEYSKSSLVMPRLINGLQIGVNSGFNKLVNALELSEYKEWNINSIKHRQSVLVNILQSIYAI